MKRKNKKKSKVVWCIGIVFLALGILACLLISHEKIKAKKAVNDFMTYYVNADGEKCGDMLYGNYSAEKIIFSDIQKIIAEKITWKIEKCHWSKDKMEIDILIRNIDFKDIGEQYKMSENVTVSLLMDAIIASETMKYYPCTVEVYQIGNKKKIAMNGLFSNALFGGINEYVEGLLNEEN